jgi:predicted protein tyrosine phosphatase
MAHPQVVILGYSEAAMFLRGTSGAEVTGIVSIHGAREFGVEAAGVGRRLDLGFDDVEVAEEGDVMGMQRVMSRRRWCELNGLVEVGPTVEDAGAIVAFAEKMRDDGGIVLCHCGAGMSRAAAGGLICLAVWRGEGAEAECVAEVLRMRRGAVPHVGLVGLADEVMGRGGRLVRALAAVER